MAEKFPDLKPCPCCGSDNIELHENVGAFQIICADCEIGTRIFCTYEAAKENWNRRATKPPTKLELLKMKKERLVTVLAEEKRRVEYYRGNPQANGDMISFFSDIHIKNLEKDINVLNNEIVKEEQNETH